MSGQSEERQVTQIMPASPMRTIPLLPPIRPWFLHVCCMICNAKTHVLGTHLQQHTGPEAADMECFCLYLVHVCTAQSFEAAFDTGNIPAAVLNAASILVSAFVGTVAQELLNQVACNTKGMALKMPQACLSC